VVDHCFRSGSRIVARASRTTRDFATAALALGAAASGACSSNGAASDPSEPADACATNANPPDGTVGGDADAAHPDAADADAADPACATQPVRLSDHPWAVKQTSAMGKSLRNLHAFHGRVYFGYGDLNANTGPIEISSYDPVAKTWADHLLLYTQSIERFVEIGNELWAPCADTAFVFDTSCQYASGDASHAWQVHSFTKSIHTPDVTERVPGEVLLGGSAFLDATQTLPGAFVWRSVGGGPFQQIFPADGGAVERDGRPFLGLATLHRVTYTGPYPWTWDGTEWTHARTPGDPVDPILLSDFIHPVTFADHIVFGTFGGYLWKFDGKNTESLGTRTFYTPTQAAFTEAPIVIFDVSEGHLLVASENGDLLMSTDLSQFRCIGKVPADVRGVGSINGVVFFGGADGHVYAYDHPSW
jgi:hypothetical protein